MIFADIASIDLGTREVEMKDGSKARVKTFYARGGVEVDRLELAKMALIEDECGSWCMITDLRKFNRCDLIWP